MSGSPLSLGSSVYLLPSTCEGLLGLSCQACSGGWASLPVWVLALSLHLDQASKPHWLSKKKKQEQPLPPPPQLVTSAGSKFIKIECYFTSSAFPTLKLYPSQLFRFSTIPAFPLKSTAQCPRQVYQTPPQWLVKSHTACLEHSETRTQIS